ncbi:MAG TPA: DUF1800 family protein [Opitutales bacterium]|jgi:uncharacterized protein (DUF1800 family)|nr:DUF1800 family protein [Opitutales bacterium]
MALNPATFSPADAWAPLKAPDWSVDNARHLLRRIGFSATPDRVQAAYKLGLQGTLEQAFGNVRPFSPPQSLADYVQERAAVLAAQSAPAPARGVGARRGAAAPATASGTAPDDAATAAALALKKRNQELNQLQRQAFLEFVQSWLAFAAKPENSAQENLVLFLGNVLVVGQSKVKDPDRIYGHANLLRTSWKNPYPKIMKSVTMSPAMIQYLDLNTSEKNGPNENYAREVMELFTLGEGHYSESDIKEAARALTGIVIRNEAGVLAPNRWDNGTKTIFGQTGRWGADDVIDLIFEQSASHTHLPRRFLAYYLSQDALPQPYLDELGRQWQHAGLRVDLLARLVFSSNLFYQPEFRGALIKSPIQYYLGLCQDLDLDVSPFEGPVYNLLKSMGQEPFNPPNVRGWLAGKNWINSSTLAARRQLVQQLFNPVNENQLNADQVTQLDAERMAGRGVIAMDNERLQKLASKSNEEISDALLGFFLAGEDAAPYHADIIDYMQNNQGLRVELVREVATALFQSPAYHLC